MRGLRGRVVLVDFWTYTCINCLRTLPYLKAWDDALPRQGADDRRRPHARVRLRAQGRPTSRAAIEPPGDRATPSSRTTNTAPGTRSPTSTGRRSTSSTPAGACATCTSARASTRRPRRRSARCCAEAGDRTLGAAARPRGQDRDRRPSCDPRDLPRHRARAELLPGRAAGRHARLHGGRPGQLPQSVFSLGGRWRVDRESARAVFGATITARVVGGAVYLVLSSAGDRPRRVRVELDGRPIRAHAPATTCAAAP